MGCALFCALVARSQSYFLNGTAQSSGGDCYQLTTTLGNQNGAVWYGELLDLTEPFDLNFTMNFGTFDATGADGMVFVLQDVGTAALGETGGGLGFNGFNPSFGIEFDTWLNGQYGDIAQDHIGFISDGSVDHSPPTGLAGPVTANEFGLNIEDGADHPVRITWDPATHIVAVYFDCALRLAAAIDLIDDVFSGQSLVYWGFTGSTGGSFNNQTVCLSPNILATGPVAQVCPGGAVELNVIGAPGSDYIWTPATFLSDTLGATVVCTPDTTTTYTVTYTGFCEDQITDSITVFVEELVAEAEAVPSSVLNCLVSEIALEGGSNFGSGINYGWELASASGNIVSADGMLATVDAAGSYLFTAISEDGVCADSLILEVQADFDTISSSIGASASQLNCWHDSIVLTASTEPGGVIQWNIPGGAAFDWIEEPHQLITANPGVWTLVTTNPVNGCTSTTSVALGMDFTAPDVDAGFADTLTCDVPTTVVQGVQVQPEEYTPVLAWNWSTGALNSLNPWSVWAPQVLLPGTYYLEVYLEETGCYGMDSVVVFQDPEAIIDVSSARLPNVISPNKDGHNERLTLYLEDQPDFPLLSIVEHMDLVIFNRWGNAIFESTGIPVEWDGRLNGELAAEGTYYCRLNFLVVCGEEQRGTIFGAFQLFR